MEAQGNAPTGWRGAPDILLVGAPKCATSSLALMLAQHPEVHFANPKEPHFHAHDLPGLRVVRTPGAYAALFAGAGPDRQTAEGSAFYLMSRAAPLAIHGANPEARIVIALRQPAEAAHSLYHQLRDGFREDRSSFAEAWALQETRARGEALPRYCPEPAQLQYRAVYSYADQVARYLQRFGTDRIQIVLQEDLKADAAGTVERLAAFLGLDPSGLPGAVPRANARRAPRYPWLTQLLAAPPRPLRPLVGPAKAALNRAGIRPSEFVMRRLSRPARAAEATLDPALRAAITRELAPDIERLEALIGRDLAHWR
jgi:hypothetical protein